MKEHQREELSIKDVSVFLYFCLSVFHVSIHSHQFAPIYKVGSFIPTKATSLAQIDDIFMFNQLCTRAKILANFYLIISFEESNCYITIGNNLRTMSNFMKKVNFSLGCEGDENPALFPFGLTFMNWNHNEKSLHHARIMVQIPRNQANHRLPRWSFRHSDQNFTKKKRFYHLRDWICFALCKVNHLSELLLNSTLSTQ